MGGKDKCYKYILRAQWGCFPDQRARIRISHKTHLALRTVKVNQLYGGFRIHVKSFRIILQNQKQNNSNIDA
jgi:hypothetical protein